MFVKRCAWVLLLILALSLAGSDDTNAQVAALVFDPTNFGANTLTSVQSVITAANSVISVANQALELLPLEEIVLAAEFVETVAIISAILEEAGALAYDVQSIQAQIDTATKFSFN
jgi:conjugal transfer/entry exclusion protein